MDKGKNGKRKRSSQRSKIGHTKSVSHVQRQDPILRSSSATALSKPSASSLQHRNVKPISKTSLRTSFGSANFNISNLHKYSKDLHTLEEMQEQKPPVVSADEEAPKFGPLTSSNMIQLVPQLHIVFNNDISSNFYLDILDQNDQRIYLVEERSSYNGGSRPFDLKIYDENDQFQFKMERKGNFLLCWCGARTYGSEMSVEGPDGCLGQVKQELTMGRLSYTLSDFNGARLGRIQGPFGCVWFPRCMGPVPIFKLNLEQGVLPAISPDLKGNIIKSSNMIQHDESQAESQGQAKDPQIMSLVKEDCKCKAGTLRRVQVIFTRAVPSILKMTTSKPNPQPKKLHKSKKHKKQEQEHKPHNKKSRVSFIDETNLSPLGSVHGYSYFTDAVSALEAPMTTPRNLKRPPAKKSTTELDVAGMPKSLPQEGEREVGGHWCSRTWRNWRKRMKRKKLIEEPSSSYAFTIEFPEGMIPEHKAVVMAAGLLINLSFYEEPRKKFCNCYGSGCFCLLCTLSFILLELLVLVVYKFTLDSMDANENAKDFKLPHALQSIAIEIDE